MAAAAVGGKRKADALGGAGVAGSAAGVMTDVFSPLFGSQKLAKLQKVVPGRPKSGGIQIVMASKPQQVGESVASQCARAVRQRLQCWSPETGPGSARSLHGLIFMPAMPAQTDRDPYKLRHPASDLQAEGSECLYLGGATKGAPRCNLVNIVCTQPPHPCAG